MQAQEQGEKGEHHMWDWDEVDPRSLLGRLCSVPDPRRRQARVYAVPGLIAMLVLAAAAGESSLRGMWLWGVERWETIGDRLGFWDVRRPPALGTVWKVMGKIDLEKLDTVFAEWSCQELDAEDRVVTIDGKTLRGSRREGETALQVVTAAGQDLKRVVAQSQVQKGAWVAAALEVLSGLPLEGKVVTMDAGLLQRSVAQTVVKKGGRISGW
ncbi:MAG: transposase family protein [Anaerolineae bacterium]